MKYKIEQGCPLLDYEISLDVDKEFYGCCYHGWYKFKTINELREWQQEQKQTFLRGEWPEACGVCKKREESVNFSLRIDSIDTENHQSFRQTEIYDPLTAVPQVKYLQLSYKNLCNYSCIMCGPSASTSIIDDVATLKRADKRAPAHWDTGFIQNNTKIVSNKRDVFGQILDVASDIKRVSFMGGEPFLIKEYLDLIKLLNNDCMIHINTNGSVFNLDFINSLKRFDKISIGFSIDGVGVINEALRLKSDWKNIENNISKMKEALPNCIFGIAPTWSNLNIYYWKDLYKWAIERLLLRQDNFPGFWQNCVETPQELRLNNLTDEWKERIITDMEHAGVPTYKVQFYESKDNSDHELIDKLDILYDVAKTRGFDYAELFPHVYYYKKDNQ